VNFGTVGRINRDLHGLVEISHVVQRDMLTMPLKPRGQTPMSSDPVRFESGHGTAVCGTGDSFVTFADPWLVENNIDVVDMELFSIAHVCYRQMLPWRAFKFITDDADDNAAEHWTANIASGETLFWNNLKQIQAS
jgi:adenosylhomocysteine nucleosidase